MAYGKIDPKIAQQAEAAFEAALENELTMGRLRRELDRLWEAIRELGSEREPKANASERAMLRRALKKLAAIPDAEMRGRIKHKAKTERDLVEAAMAKRRHVAPVKRKKRKAKNHG